MTPSYPLRDAARDRERPAGSAVGRRRRARSRSAAATALLAALLLGSCSPALRIQDRPISFSSARRDATLAYIAEHYGEHPADISISPRIIVLHWTAIDDFEESFAAFDSEELPTTRPDLVGAGHVNVSIHFLVAREGAVYRLMPESWMARHVIGLNHSAIGIENVGGGDSVDNLTADQVAANVRLVRYLAARYPSIEYLIGHSEYREFEDHPLWRELDESYRTEKVDPGARFMAAVRKQVAGLALKGPREIRAEKGALQPWPRRRSERPEGLTPVISLVSSSKI